ncbi:MAG: LysM peptidoglycan-binding domain-containing protein [Spirochaetales bacterium]|nr:LysM peptidoglycan-binding domain-containing protein [Spirochaetales bacterium]
MARDSYDDMLNPDPRSRRGSSSSKVGLIAAFCVLLCLVAVVLYLLFAPPQEERSEKVVSHEPISIEVKEPVKVSPESETVKEEVKIVEEKSVSVEPKESEKVVARELSQAIKQDINPSSKLTFTEHVVQEGQTLTDIAKLYSLKPETIISVNKIKNIAAITKGVTLMIPDRDGVYYTVKDGDMLSKIVRRFDLDMTWKELQELNGLKSENIKVGQELFIPDPVESIGVVSASSISFSSPLKGSITASFGQTKDGKSVKGIFITATAGTPVTAAGKGAVVDAGVSDELGRFVVISHEEGYKTTYAYLERVEVKVGSEVEKGDIIASVGLSSVVPSTLYFMLEQSGITLNPEIFI